MLTRLFDISIAEYQSLTEVDVEEIQKADLIQIKERVPGGIHHAQKLIWKGNVAGITHPFDFIRSKREKKMLVENKDFFLHAGYQIKITPLTPALLTEFVQLYKQTTLQRKRAIHFDVEQQVTDFQKQGRSFSVLGLFKQQTLDSALLISRHNQQLRVHFGAKKRYSQVRGGVGGVLELQLLEYCIQHGVTEIVHGIGTNPSGLISKAGVFEFKARYGYTAYPHQEWVSSFLINPSIALSDLIFVSQQKKQLVYHVVTDREAIDSKEYSTHLVDTYHRYTFDEVVSEAKQFVTNITNRKKRKS